jgi:hypothetical protein
MQATAGRLGLHLGGSLMLVEEGEIFNALLLFAPDGRWWRYDKTHPWGWERAYFRGGKGAVVAHTDLGDIGMLICWDTGHRGLWQQYRKRIDLALVCSCPPDISNPTYHLNDGRQVTFDDLGPFMHSLKGLVAKVFGQMIPQQSAWLGVPAVTAGASGHIRTRLPTNRLTWMGMASVAPWALKDLGKANPLELSCDFSPSTAIFDRQGQTLSQVLEPGDALILAETPLPVQKRAPAYKQPPSTASGLAYFISDFYLPGLCANLYRRNKRLALQAISQGG